MGRRKKSPLGNGHGLLGPDVPRPASTSTPTEENSAYPWVAAASPESAAIAVPASIPLPSSAPLPTALPEEMTIGPHQDGHLYEERRMLQEERTALQEERVRFLQERDQLQGERQKIYDELHDTRLELKQARDEAKRLQTRVTAMCDDVNERMRDFARLCDVMVTTKRTPRHV